MKIRSLQNRVLKIFKNVEFENRYDISQKISNNVEDNDNLLATAFQESIVGLKIKDEIQLKKLISSLDVCKFLNSTEIELFKNLLQSNIQLHQKAEALSNETTEKLVIAKRMLDKGADLMFISECTGLSLTEIAELKII